MKSRIYQNISKNLFNGSFQEIGATSGTPKIKGPTITWEKDQPTVPIKVTMEEKEGTVPELRYRCQALDSKHV